MDRLDFLKHLGFISAGMMLMPVRTATGSNIDFPVVRVSKAQRNFSSTAIEKAIDEFKRNVKDPEVTWLFENCFPNTLDTTVFLKSKGTNPDTYIITGDIDAMW